MNSPAPDPLLAVARLIRPHGLRGEVSTIVLAPAFIDPVELLVGRRFVVRASESGVGSRNKSEIPDPKSEIKNAAFRMPAAIVVEGARPHQDRWLLKLAGIETMTDAEAARGCDLCLARADLPPLPADSYWEADLIGCRIVDARLGELGECAGLDTSGPRDQLVVRRADGASVLVPLVRAYVREIDPVRGEIGLTLPEGFPGIEDE
jgi:16S rRNA processing protein RimM